MAAAPRCTARRTAKPSRRGYATNNGEWRADIAAVAAAILHGGGKPVASLSVSTPISRTPPEVAARYGALVRDAARRVSTTLGYQPPGGR